MRRQIAGAAALLTAIALAGCGSSSDSGRTQESTVSEAAASSEAKSDDIIIPTDSGELVDEEATPEHLSEFVELGEYKGLSIEADPADGIKENLVVSLDYKTSIDGKEVEGVAAEGLEVTVGQEEVIKGFDEKLVGHKPGDEFSFVLAIPEDYPDDSISGKDVTYDVSILNVYHMSPDIASAFFMDSCKVKKYPRSLFDTWSRIYLNDYAGYSGSGSDAPDKEEVLSSMGLSEEMFEDMIKGIVKEVLVTDSVFQAEGVDRDSEEYQELMNAYLEKSGYSSVEEAVSKGMPEDYIRNNADAAMLKKILIKYEAK